MSDFPGFPSPFSTWNQYTTSRTSFPAGNIPLSGFPLGFSDPGFLPGRAAALPDPFSQLPTNPLRAFPSVGQARLHPGLYLADVPGLEPLYACSLPGLPEPRSLLHSPNLTLPQNPSPLTFDQIYRASSSVSPVSQYRNQFDQRYINSRLLLPNRLAEPKLHANSSLDFFHDHKERRVERKDKTSSHFDKSHNDNKVEKQQKVTDHTKRDSLKSKIAKIWNPFESEDTYNQKDSPDKEASNVSKLTESDTELNSLSKDRCDSKFGNENNKCEVSAPSKKTFPAVPIPHYPVKPFAVYDTSCRDYPTRSVVPAPSLFSPGQSQFKSCTVSCSETQSTEVQQFQLKNKLEEKESSSEKSKESKKFKNVEKDLNQNIEVEKNCNLLNLTASLDHLDSKKNAELVTVSEEKTYEDLNKRKNSESGQCATKSNYTILYGTNEQIHANESGLTKLENCLPVSNHDISNVYNELGEPVNNSYSVPYEQSSSLYTDTTFPSSFTIYNNPVVAHSDTVITSLSYNTFSANDHQKSDVDTHHLDETEDTKDNAKQALSTQQSPLKSKLCSPKSLKELKGKTPSVGGGIKTRTGARREAVSVKDELSALSNQVNEIRSRRNSINKENIFVRSKPIEIAQTDIIDKTFISTVENPKASVVYKYKPSKCSKFGRSLKMASTESALSMLKNSEDSLSASISSSQISESDSDTQMSNDHAEKLFSESQSLNTRSMFPPNHGQEPHNNFMSPMNPSSCEDGQYFKGNTNPPQMCQMDNDNQKPYLCVQDQGQFSDKAEMLPPYNCYASNQSESVMSERGSFPPHEENSNFTITSGRGGIDTMDSSIDYDENSVGVSDSNQAVHDCESQLSQGGDSLSHKAGIMAGVGHCGNNPDGSGVFLADNETSLQWEFLHSKQYIDNIYGNQMGCEPVKTDTESIRDSDSPKTFIDLDTTTKEKKARDSMHKDGKEGFHAKHYGKTYQRANYQRGSGMYGNQSYDGYSMGGRWNNFSRNGNDGKMITSEMDSSQYENGQYRNNYQSGYSQMNHGQNGNDKGFAQSGYHGEYNQNPPNYYNQNQSVKNYQGNYGNSPRGYDGGNYYGSKGDYNNSPHNMYPPNSGEMMGARFGSQGYGGGQGGFGSQHYNPQSPSHGSSDGMGGQYPNHSGHSFNLPRNSSPASTVSDFAAEPPVVVKKKRGRKRKVDKDPPDESKPKPNTVVTASMSIGPLIDVDNPDCPIETYDYNQQIETIFNFKLGDDLSPIGAQFLKIEQRVSHKLLPIKYGHPVTVVYNPLSYAFQTHRDFVSKYCTSERPILFLGMNPGPYGMSQNGVPFGEATVTRDWLKICGDIYKPEVEHPKKPVTGLACTRNEVSGARFWGLFQKICKVPENFFKNCFVYNFCPYAYMSESGKNITPPQLTHSELDQITETCDVGLVELVKLLNTRVIIAVGKFVQTRASKALHNAGIMNVKVECILHPSPINPHANKGWEQIVAKQLVEMNVMHYLNSDMEEVQAQIEEWEKIAASNAKLAE